MLRLDGLRSRASHVARAAAFYAALFLLAVLCLGVTLVLALSALLLNRERRVGGARRLISWMFRTQLRAAAALRLCRFDLSQLDALGTEGGLIIAPNHPSIIDAALVLSRVPNAVCIMKSQVLANPLFGAGARMAGYIPNGSPRTMLRDAVASLREGSNLLLFPEGTRTARMPLDGLQRTVGALARRAGAPVQTVLLETDSPFLCKGWPLLAVPRLPMRYRARLGHRFASPTDPDALCEELEQYFRAELAGAMLPVLPKAAIRARDPQDAVGHVPSP